jgi:hypothetical protein
MANPTKSNRLSSMLSLGYLRNDSASSLPHSSSASHPEDGSQDYAPCSPGPTPQSSSMHIKLHERSPSAGSNLPPPPPISADRLPRSSSAGSQLCAYGGGQASREGSRSRPTTPVMLAPQDTRSSSRPQSPISAKASKRRSRLSGKADKSPVGQEKNEPQAWIAGLKEHIPYSLLPLITGEKVRHIAPRGIYYLANVCPGSGALERSR